MVLTTYLSGGNSVEEEETKEEVKYTQDLNLIFSVLNML